MAVTALDANLLLSSTLLLVALALPRLQPRWPAWLRMALRLAGFAAATVLVQRILGSPLAPRFDAPDPDRRLWEQVVEAGWWVLAGQVASGAARVFIVLKHRPRETRILSDLLSGVITVATGLAIITFAFSVPIGGLLATSGVVAIVLGLALQSTLSDVFSGIAVGLEKPYAVGDLLWVEGGIEGTVRQVNWRSTQIATFDGNVAIVPNSIIAKARLINRSEPTPRRSDSVDIKVDPNAPPPSCAAALEAAVRNCGSILDQPAPTVLCRSLEGDGLSYRITFSVAASSGLPGARSELYDRVQHHLRCAGIGLAVPGKGKPRRLGRPSLMQLLERSELFGALAEGHRAALADQFTPIAADTGTLCARERRRAGRVADDRVRHGWRVAAWAGRTAPGQPAGTRRDARGSKFGHRVAFYRYGHRPHAVAVAPDRPGRSWRRVGRGPGAGGGTGSPCRPGVPIHAARPGIQRNRRAHATGRLPRPVAQRAPPVERRWLAQFHLLRSIR